jgi:hypothetical protein
LPQVNLGLIPKEYLGTQSTLKHVQALIRAGAKDFYARQKAIDILLEKPFNPRTIWEKSKHCLSGCSTTFATPKIRFG